MIYIKSFAGSLQWDSTVTFKIQGSKSTQEHLWFKWVQSHTLEVKADRNYFAELQHND